MNIPYPYLNSENPESVNETYREAVDEASRLWDDPEFVLKFVDLICGWSDDYPPS